VFCSAAQDQSLVTLRLEGKTGQVTRVAKLKTPGEPGALTVSPDGSLLLAAMRSTGKLASFRINRTTGELTALNEVDGGADPAQISSDRTGRYLFTAYYVAAKVSVHQINDDGSLGKLPEQVIMTAEKAHAIVPDATNRFVFVPHTGPNTIFQFEWDRSAGRLKPQAQPRLDRPQNTGPRHLAWHPTKPIAYIDNEQASSVTAFRLRESGSLEPGVTVPTLPADFRGDNSTAEIKVHPFGRFLYVSNRGHDSLAVIGIDEMGEKLSFIATEATEKTPRSFDLDAGGRYLLSAGESSGRLAISRIDPATGRLTLQQTEEIGPMLWWVQMGPAVDAK
jgi:6-phosphogluconolactonase